jgi:hypothetical protein
MRKFIVFFSLLLLSAAGFSQEETNGTIYIKHPYIQVVYDEVKAYLNKDDAANRKIYADTAKFWYSNMGDQKPISLDEVLKSWDNDFNYFDSVDMKQVGYPDYLHYKQGDAKIVQSWWTWSGISKKSGKKVVVNMVLFDWFNDDGKVVFEAGYGNFDALEKEEM